MTDEDLFTDAFFSDSFDLEKFIDEFIESVGGKRIKDILTEPPDFSNADYYFRKQNILIELKILKTEFASSPFQLEKLNKLVNEWVALGKLKFSSVLGFEPLPDDFVLEHLKLLRKPLKQITNKANKQIKETKKALKLKNAQGLLLVLNDGFYEIPPETTLALIGDPMQRQMKSIDGYVHFNLRKSLIIPGDKYPRIFWLPKYRSSENDVLGDFVDFLGKSWFKYLENLSGVKFRSSLISKDPENTYLKKAVYE